MRFASFLNGQGQSWGIVEGDSVVDIGASLKGRFPDLKSFLAAGEINEAQNAAASAARLPLAGIDWLPVIPNPGKILCVGVNYEEHRQETGRAKASYPTIFTRFANTQTGHLTHMIRPLASVEFDYEGELAVIIGKTGRRIAKENALGHIAGFACYNDGSVRDWQRHSHQFTPGKNFPQSGAFGPWMVTTGDLPDLASPAITTRLNGDVVQSAALGDMIFDIPTLIEYCSAFNPLEPGDVLITGTPGGVGARRTPPLWLKHGDTVEVEIEGIGILRNTVSDEIL